MNNIPITPFEAKLLVKYFDSVDNIISNRLQKGFNPHEEHLNSILCEMLDENMTSLHCLSYPFSKLKEELKSRKSLLNFDFQIETKKYPPQIEKHVTSSDLGIILKYKNWFENKNNFEKAIILQGKKLFKNGNDYSLFDKYKSFKNAQLLNLYNLNTYEDREMHHHKSMGPFEKNFAFYLFYNPTLDGFDYESQQRISYFINSASSTNIFDFSKGWHLYDLINSDTSKISQGLLVSNLNWLKGNRIEEKEDKLTALPENQPNASEVYSKIFSDVNYFSWFLVYEFILGNCGSSDYSDLSIARGETKKDVPQFIPSYVLNISLSIGTNPEIKSNI